MFYGGVSIIFLDEIVFIVVVAVLKQVEGYLSKTNIIDFDCP